MDTLPFSESATSSWSYALVIAAAVAAGNQSMLIGGRRAWDKDDYQSCWDELERLCPDNREGDHRTKVHTLGRDAGSGPWESAVNTGLVDRAEGVPCMDRTVHRPAAVGVGPEEAGGWVTGATWS